MEKYEKLLANKTESILKRHTKAHEEKELLELGKKIPMIKAAFNIGEDWSPNTTYEEGKRHHSIFAHDEYGTDIHLYLGSGDTLSSAIKFVAGHEERRNFKLYEKDDPENLPEGREHYRLIWSIDGTWSWNERLEIQIHFNTKAECKMIPTGESTPIMKLVCNGDSSKAAEMLTDEKVKE